MYGKAFQLNIGRQAKKNITNRQYCPKTKDGNIVVFIHPFHLGIVWQEEFSLGLSTNNTDDLFFSLQRLIYMIK